MSTIETVLSHFSNDLNCAQSLLLTYGPGLGLGRDHALKIAAAFGSGMEMGATCGAVTGALMVIGLKYTEVDAHGSVLKERAEELTHEFLVRFAERNGTTACRELLGCDVNTSEGRAVAEQRQYFKNRCPQYVRDAAEILEELIDGR